MPRGCPAHPAASAFIGAGQLCNTRSQRRGRCRGPTGMQLLLQGDTALAREGPAPASKGLAGGSCEGALAMAAEEMPASLPKASWVVEAEGHQELQAGLRGLGTNKSTGCAAP